MALAGATALFHLLASTPTLAQDGASATSIEALDADATALFKKGDHRGALAKFEAVYVAHPNSITAWNIARCHEELGELFAAIAAFERFSRVPGVIEAERVAARERIDGLQRRIREAAEAVDAGREALERGFHAQAIDRFEASLALHPTAEAYLGLADAYFTSGDVDSARAALQRCLQLPRLTDSQRIVAQERLAGQPPATPASAAAPSVDQPTAAAPVGEAPGPAPSTPTTPRPVARAEASSNVASWLLLGLGVVGLGTGAWGAVQVDATNDEIARLGRVDALSADEIALAERLPGEGETWQTLEWIGLGVGAAATMTAIILLLADDETPEPRARLWPWADAESIGVTLQVVP